MPTKVLIAFYSRNGFTEALANAVADGARAAGAEMRLRRACEVVGPEAMAKAQGWAENAARMNQAYEPPTEADAEWADAIVFGTPTRFVAAAADLEAHIDSLGGLWFQGKLVGKVGSVFTSISTTHGGNELTLLSLYNPMAHFDFIIVPLGYADPVLFRAGTPYGASSVSVQNSALPSADDLEVARFQGRRVTQVARRSWPPASRKPKPDRQDSRSGVQVAPSCRRLSHSVPDAGRASRVHPAVQQPIRQ
ncbi:MAG TPA: NAD(P)H:quinone oxidoreductase [Roseomonas sp.]|nr:NAD(P)H:quinone oxidoreductase [Roseomonas sp.]